MEREFGYKANGQKQARVGTNGAFGRVVRPVGDERESKGYTYVKTAAYPTEPMTKDNWKLKQVLIWEQTHGETLPEGWIVRFKDGNTHNFDPDNLCAMTRGENITLNQAIKRFGIKEVTAGTFDALRNYCKLSSKMAERERHRPRQCGVCGKWFVPDIVIGKYGEQANNKVVCRECLNQGKKPSRRKKND